MSKLGDIFRDLENTLQAEVELNIKINQNVQTNTTKINFNSIEIKTIKGELRRINNGRYNTKPGTIEAIDKIKIENKPMDEVDKMKIENKPKMGEVVNEFKTIDLKTHLTKVPEDVLNRATPEANPNSYHEFIKSKKSVEA